MKIYVNIDSMIDIITNSSSEVYTFPADGAVETVKKIINSILEEAGSDKTCDDVFVISIEPGYKIQERFYDNITLIQKNHIERFPELKSIGGKEEIIKYLRSDPIIERKVIKRWADENPGESHEYRLSITSKDGTPHIIENLMRRVFESEEIYD